MTSNVFNHLELTYFNRHIVGRDTLEAALVAFLLNRKLATGPLYLEGHRTTDTTQEVCKFPILRFELGAPVHALPDMEGKMTGSMNLVPVINDPTFTAVTAFIGAVGQNFRGVSRFKNDAESEMRHSHNGGRLDYDEEAWRVVVSATVLVKESVASWDFAYQVPRPRPVFEPGTQVMFEEDVMHGLLYSIPKYAVIAMVDPLIADGKFANVIISAVTHHDYQHPEQYADTSKLVAVDKLKPLLTQGKALDWENRKLPVPDSAEEVMALIPQWRKRNPA